MPPYFWYNIPPSILPFYTNTFSFKFDLNFLKVVFNSIKKNFSNYYFISAYAAFDTLIGENLSTMFIYFPWPSQYDIWFSIYFYQTSYTYTNFRVNYHNPGHLVSPPMNQVVGYYAEFKMQTNV